MAAPSKELLFAQTEEYVEYDKMGSVRRGQERAIAKSKYVEDVHTHNHTEVWGSFFDRTRFRWVYADDHSTTLNSYGTGEAGKRARAAAAAAALREAPDRSAPISLPTGSSGTMAPPSKAMYGMAEELGEQALDEAKVKAAMKAERERQKSEATDDRKRKFNSMVSDEVTPEAMEAYHRSKARADDPMANVTEVATDDEA